jgi:hypothetical protein
MFETPNGYGVNMNYKSNYEFEIGSEVGTIDENLSSIKRNGGKFFNQNERKLSYRCLQSNHKC